MAAKERKMREQLESEKEREMERFAIELESKQQELVEAEIGQRLEKERSCLAAEISTSLHQEISKKMATKLQEQLESERARIYEEVSAELAMQDRGESINSEQLELLEAKYEAKCQDLEAKYVCRF